LEQAQWRGRVDEKLNIIEKKIGDILTNCEAIMKTQNEQGGCITTLQNDLKSHEESSEKWTSEHDVLHTKEKQNNQMQRKEQKEWSFRKLTLIITASTTFLSLIIQIAFRFLH